MHHIDEHTLELYALKADEIADRVNEIEEHLRKCHGCRALVEEMRGYYSDLDEELKQQPAVEISAEKALIRQRNHIKPYYAQFAPPVHYRPNTPLAKIYYFVRRHPVVTMASGFMMIAAFGWLFNDAIRSFTNEKKITDTNPASYYLNNSTGFLEIKNKENQKLWELASNKIDAFSKRQVETRILSTVVTDLNDDGMNEILTVLPPPQDELLKRNYLRIYSSDQKLLREIPFGRPINYRDREYQNDFTSDGVFVADFNSGEKEIFVLTKNIRSPSIVTRLDKNGNMLGEYWHFGFIMDLCALDVNNDGKKDLVLFGVNDVSDTNHQEFPMITVLDPKKIVDKIESQCSPGFGLTRSEAEFFYIRFPRSDMDDLLYLTPSPLGISFVDEKSIRFTTISQIDEKHKFNFDYLFSHDLKPLWVKSNNQTDQIHYDLVQQGKLKGKIDQAYLDNLKKGIRYWDGKVWRKEWTRVQLKSKN
ncbi:MAG: hypothetical protein C0417_09180 [Chlorobiaceae bacterium]|nr:hypothetical protein [Chlorobiaceae bacterium]